MQKAFDHISGSSALTKDTKKTVGRHLVPPALNTVSNKFYKGFPLLLKRQLIIFLPETMKIIDSETTWAFFCSIHPWTMND